MQMDVLVSVVSTNPTVDACSVEIFTSHEDKVVVPEYSRDLAYRLYAPHPPGWLSW